MKQNPSYYSILTANVRYDRRLKPNEKLMYSEITALSNAKGYCSASNSYFSKLYGRCINGKIKPKRKTTISHWLNDLKRLGYIKVNVIRNRNHEIVSRHIYAIDKKLPPIAKKSNRYCLKKHTPIAKKSKGNTTRDNNTRLNNENEKTNSEYRKVIRYYDQRLILNRLHGNQYRQLEHSIDDWIYKFSLKDIQKAIDVAHKTDMTNKLYNPISYISKVLNNLAEKHNDIKAKREQDSFNDDYVSPDEQKKEIHQQIKDMVERSKHGKLFRD